MRSFLSAPLVHGGQASGAMKVYSTQVDAFDERDEDLLRRFGEQAAIFVANVQTVEAATRFSDEEAFRHLMTESHRARRSLRDAAESIVGSSTDE